MWFRIGGRTLFHSQENLQHRLKNIYEIRTILLRGGRRNGNQIGGQWGG